MYKSFKPKNNTYIDSSGIMHNRKLLSNILYDINSYSTSEHIIGTWINGKPIYRKTLSFIPETQSASYSTNISDFEQLINAYGSTIRTASTYRNLIPCNYINWEIYFYDIRPTAFTLKFSNNQWSAGVGQTYITLEYTKTTD